MKRTSIFWPLTMIAAGVILLLSTTKIIPPTNLWALLHLLPYLLIALGIGLILRSRWKTAGMLVSALVVIGATAAVIFAPQLGWARVPSWGLGPEFGGAGALAGKIATETRAAEGFSRIELNYPADVIILQGDTESVKLEADTNLLPQLSTRVNGKTLTIQNDESDWAKRVGPGQMVKITITVKDLQAVDFSTAGTVRLESLEAGDLSIKLSGAGDITITDLNARQLATSLSGAGNITASGKADDVSVKISGFGSFYGDKLASLQADVKISGAGNVNLQVKDRLSADINGAGSIGYYGTPDITQDINGAGSVSQLGK